MQKVYTVDGFTGNIKQIAEHFGMNQAALANRLRKGMSIEEAVSKPNMNEKMYTVNGFTGNIKQIAAYFGMNYVTLARRLYNGIAIEEAISKPVVQKGKNAKVYTVDGFTDNIKQIARHLGISKDTLACRLRAGMTIDEAVNVPLKYVHQSNLEYRGVKGSMKELCEYFDKNYVEVYNLVKHVHTFEWAMDHCEGHWEGE